MLARRPKPKSTLHTVRKDVSSSFDNNNIFMDQLLKYYTESNICRPTGLTCPVSWMGILIFRCSILRWCPCPKCACFFFTITKPCGQTAACCMERNENARHPWNFTGNRHSGFLYGTNGPRPREQLRIQDIYCSLLCLASSSTIIIYM